MKNLSLKASMITVFIALITLTGLLLTGLSFINAKKMAKELTKHALTMKMNGDINSAKQYVQKYLGSIKFKNGTLTDTEGNLIEGNFTMVDAIAKDLGVVATIFAKENNDFRRISTNIMKPDGSRAVGTFLGSSSAAYAPVMEKERFIGQAVILGESYLTAYDPILAENGSLIGILFVGIPQGEVNAIAKEHANNLLVHSSVTFLLILVISVVATVLFAVALSRKISRYGSELYEGTNEVNMAANQLAHASNSLAEGATEQAASLEETASSLEEMATMTRHNANNASEANELAENAKTAAGSGAQSMRTMLQAIHEIQDSANKTANIVKVIDEIAFQTNLLALNAAVEAARAGEAGKGFSVVAEEVRNLAKRSAEAAKDTTDLINASVGNAASGVKLSEDVNMLFEEIVESISKVSNIVSQISNANYEQAQGIEQINEAVAQVDIVTQRNAAGAEESASAASELTSQAESMRKSVAHLHALINGARENHPA